MLLYWFTTILFTSLGLFLVWVFLQKVLWESWTRYKSRKEFAKKNPQRAKQLANKRKRNQKKDSIFGHIFGFILVIFIFIGIPSFCFYITGPNILDLPRAITGSYKEITGEITHKVYVEFEGKSWGYPYIIYIDGVPYSSSIMVDEYIGESTTVDVLPHAKVIIHDKD